MKRRHQLPDVEIADVNFRRPRLPLWSMRNTQKQASRVDQNWAIILLSNDATISNDSRHAVERPSAAVSNCGVICSLAVIQMGSMGKAAGPGHLSRCFKGDCLPEYTLGVRL
jgi:hypothetical protein